MTPFTTSVLIIGAGPTGLMAANQLNRFGIDFIIIDSKNGPTEQSRAIAITSRSLEIYEQMGLSDEVITEGQRITSFHFYSQGKERGVIELGIIGEGLSDFNYFLGFEQSKNEELLVNNLKRHDQDVMWKTGFVKLNEYENTIEAVVNHHGEEKVITANYLIACDGARSPVRHQLNMKFEGGTYQNKFFVADTILSWDIGYESLVISPGDRNFVGFFPMKGKSNYRVLGTLPDEYFTNDDITFEEIKNVILNTIGIPIEFQKVNWFSIYNLHHRRVDKFDKGKVFFAGDAAHIHSPAGGQGMNTGLQDAYNLAWKLAFVLKGHAQESLLQTYNEERLPFAKWLMSFTDRGFNLMTSDNWFIAKLRKHVAVFIVGFVLKGKWVRPKAFKTVSQIGYSYFDKSLSHTSTKQKLKFKAGDRLPYITSDDGKNSIYQLFTAPVFHLLHIGNVPLSAKYIRELEKSFNFPVVVVENKLTSAWKREGVQEELFVIVRPDNYILSISDHAGIADLMKSFASHFVTT